MKLSLSLFFPRAHWWGLLKIGRQVLGGGLGSVHELRNVSMEFIDSIYNKKIEIFPFEQLVSRTNLSKCLEYSEEFSNYFILFSFCE